MAEESFDSMTRVHADTTEIKREIERTRVEMGETLGEIQERLRPNHIIQQAKDTVTVAATGKVRNIMHSAGETATRVADQTRYAGRNVADYASGHPLQMALIAGGVTWLLLRGRGHRFDTDFDTDFDSHLDADATYGQDRSLSNTAGDYAASARDTVNEYAASARETVGEYTGAARESARRASARVRDAANTASVRARETWQRTSTSVDHWVHDNPLAAGAVAVAVGAAIGLSVPGSRFEDRTFGERRDQAMARARAKARELTDTVTQKVEKAAEVAGVAGAPSAPGALGATSAAGAGAPGASTMGRG